MKVVIETKEEAMEAIIKDTGMRGFLGENW